MRPEATSDPHTSQLVRTPASRAASGLPPVANMKRPSGVCSNTNQMITAKISM